MRKKQRRLFQRSVPVKTSANITDLTRFITHDCAVLVTLASICQNVRSAFNALTDHPTFLAIEIDGFGFNRHVTTIKATQIAITTKMRCFSVVKGRPILTRLKCSDLIDTKWVFQSDHMPVVLRTTCATTLLRATRCRNAKCLCFSEHLFDHRIRNLSFTVVGLTEPDRNSLGPPPVFGNLLIRDQTRYCKLLGEYSITCCGFPVRLRFVLCQKLIETLQRRSRYIPSVRMSMFLVAFDFFTRTKSV